MINQEGTYRHYAKNIRLSEELSSRDMRLLKEMCISCMNDYAQSHIFNFLNEIPKDIKSNEEGWNYTNRIIVDYLKKYNITNKK